MLLIINNRSSSSCIIVIFVIFVIIIILSTGILSKEGPCAKGPLGVSAAAFDAWTPGPGVYCVRDRYEGLHHGCYIP